MVDHQVPTRFATSLMANALHLRDAALNASGDESIFPASTLSAHSDYDSSSDMTSLLLTARSASPTNLLEENGFGLSVNDTTTGTHSTIANLSMNNSFGPKNLGVRMTHQPTYYFSEQNKTMFMPIPPKGVHSQRSTMPSQGMSKMLLSLSDHPVERPCTPNASTLYRNTKTHCNPSGLGQHTYDECMFFTRWANSFLQHSQDPFLITDLARDLGNGLTLLSLVEMLVGEFPPQIHIKPALDVQKMENVQTCLDFLEYYDVSVNGITAEDIVKGNLKVVLALCHCLYRQFASIPAAKPGDYHHPVDKDDLSLFNWVSKITGKQVTGFQSFQDGTVLCLLLNKILEDSVPKLVLEFGSPSEKVSLALKVSSEQLGIVTSLQEEDITKQRRRETLLEYLKSLYRLQSSRTKSVDNAPEQSDLNREIKRLQLREQRLKERYGSQPTYLGDLRQNKSRIARERPQLSQANPSVNTSISERLNNRRLLGESKEVSPGNTTNSDAFDNKERQLEELEKELRLLLDCSDESYENKRLWTDQPGQSQLSTQGDLSPIIRASKTQRRQTNPRQELRNVYRGNFGKKTQDIVGNCDLDTTARYNTFESDPDNDQLPFGGCYLCEPRDGFDNSGRSNLEHSRDDSFIFKDYSVEPSFLGETRTFSPQKSSRIMENSHGLFPKSSTETKGISNLFEVDFTDFDARMSRDQENSAVKRMIRAGNRSKLDSRSKQGLVVEPRSNRRAAGINGEMAKPLLSSTATQDRGERLGAFERTLRRGLDAELSANRGNGEMAKPLLCSITDRDQAERLGTAVGSRPRHDLGKLANPLSSSSTKQNNREQSAMPFSSLLSSRSMHKDERSSILKESPSSMTYSREPSEPTRQLQRSLSKEKRYREQVLAKKSARNIPPSASTKTHLHALTTLIRSSAKNAGASCSEED